jgi:hypothetical protein
MSNFFEFKTITGVPTKLNYLQQCIVRSKNFKKWFGDWQSVALNRGIVTPQANYNDIFSNYFVENSTAIDLDTLEPKVFYHGTVTEKQFFEFDTNQKYDTVVNGFALKKRPYGYFAFNKEYSENFSDASNRANSLQNGYVYDVFLRSKRPFDAQFFMAIKWNFLELKQLLCITIYGQAYQYASAFKENKNIIGNFWDAVNRQNYTDEFIQIVDELDSIYNGIDDDSEIIFWQLLARDYDKGLKLLLKWHGFDSIYYEEQFDIFNYNKNDKKSYTKAIAVFDPEQIKLANGENIYFDNDNPDIRYYDGGKTHINSHPSNTKAHELVSKYMPKYAIGGMVEQDRKRKTNDAKRGGYFVGKSHAEGGIKAKNIDTGEYLEVEGNEVIITKKAVADNTKRMFEGEMLTNREILSKINVGGGGVSFASGGEIEKCRCSGKSYKYGGETKNDYQIINMMNYE